MKSQSAFTLIGAALANVFLGAALYAGPLGPPPGPVTPSNKTLQEVEPRIAIDAANTPGDADSLFKITAPGSYYLTDNVTGVVGKHGIKIATSNVTLDLNGYSMVGVTGQGAFDGITTSISSLSSINIRNGTIRNWGGDGIDLRTSIAQGGRVTDVTVMDNAAYGINTGSRFQFTNCTAYSNDLDGINTSSGCTFNACISNNNNNVGIHTSENCTLNDCTTSANEVGIRVFRFCTLTNCTAGQNGGPGIDASSTANLPVATTISHCTANQNLGAGIATGINCIVDTCTSSDNELEGIFVLSGGLIVNCSTFRNFTDGIRCTSRCIIRGNICSNNGDLAGIGAGVHCTSSDNRIEDNVCCAADTGIDISGAGNIIVRNSCTGNTQNFTIAANNIFGTIVDRTSPGSPAVGGNAAAGTMGSTDPNANFAY